MLQKYLYPFILRHYFPVVMIGVFLFSGFAPMMIVAEAQTPPRRVNIPHFNNNVSWARSALFWFGQNKLSLPGKNYADVRTGYTDSGLQIRVTVVDYFLWYNPNATALDDLTQYDAATIYIDTNPNGSTTPQTSSYQFLIGARHWQNIDNYARQAQGTGGTWNSGWTPPTAWSAFSNMSWGCDPGPNNNNCSVDFGWTAFYTIPWSTFGLNAPPAEGTVWRYAVQLYDRDDQPPAGAVAPEYWPETFAENNPSTWADLHFGYANFQPASIPAQGTTVIRAASPTDNTVEDAWMGGGGWCNSGQEGNRQGSDTNHGNDSELYVGNETAETNFPCFNKSFLRFSLDDIPAGKEILSATLTLHLWGNANHELAQPSWIHLYSIKDAWAENTITWNNAPLAYENIAVTQVDPYPLSSPDWPGAPYNWDATQAVAEAYGETAPVNLALYSSDSAEHSSKYLTASEAGDWDAEGRPTLTVVWGSANPMTVAPTVRAIDAGGEANYTLHIEPAAGFASPVNLSVSPALGLQLNLSATTITPPADVILTAIDTHTSGTLSPGTWHQITITANSGNVGYDTTVNLLVGGTRVYLPLLLRNF